VGFQNAGRAAPEQTGNGPQLSSSAADFQTNSHPRPNAQIKFPAPAGPGFDAEIALPRSRLRLVPPVPPPRRLLAVRINVLDGRSPFGRSRTFRLAHDELDELIAIATRMERRA
jgi:hypothetical protein